MTRRLLLTLSVATCFAADPAGDAAAVITELATSLTARNAQQSLTAFDRAMPGYDKLRENVEPSAYPSRNGRQMNGFSRIVSALSTLR